MEFQAGKIVRVRYDRPSAAQLYKGQLVALVEKDHTTPGAWRVETLEDIPIRGYTYPKGFTWILIENEDFESAWRTKVEPPASKVIPFDTVQDLRQDLQKLASIRDRLKAVLGELEELLKEKP